MIRELDELTSLGGELTRRAHAAGVFLTVRAQSSAARSAVVREGRVESVSAHSASGHGLHVVTGEGRSALAARDDLGPEPALALLDRVIGLARGTPALHVAPQALPALAQRRGADYEADVAGFAEIRLDAVGRRLVELEGELRRKVSGVKVSTSYRAELEGWRVFRSDGSDVAFGLTRCILGVHASSGSDGARHGISSSVFSNRPDLPWDEAALGTFLKRAEAAARLARELPAAPTHPAGSFPLVIDYALAKGLAHEAFGHAAEADGFRSSVLARAGRYRQGETVGAEHVSIIDEPVRRDHAWQPFGLDGEPRERAVIVRAGRLADALADLWSAAAAGVRATGAARAQSFRAAPQPRMSNIRIEVEGARPAPGEFEDYDPAAVRQLLGESGVLARHPRVVYLSGYSGGQVNPSTGDFVFNCKAIYTLEAGRITLHKPAIFSGSMFGALHSIREAFGPLKLDALGYCGKWGQRVPSSGGSHYFVVLDPHPEVRLGGH